MHRDFSFWEYDTYYRMWDVAIIGSGINGLSAGISILEREPDTKVVIVDRWFIPLGASTRNAGFSCFGSPSEIADDIRTMGEEAAMSLVSQRWKGLNKLKKRLHGSLASYEENGGYELFSDDQFRDIFDKLPYINQLVSEAIELPFAFEEVRGLSGIQGFARVLKNPLEGQLHPAWMMEHLKMQFEKLGGKIWTGLTVEAIEEKEDKVVLSNALAIPVEASKVIVTTNAFATQLLPELDICGARNHVLVTEPIKDLGWKGCYHYDKGFYYFRNIGDRILLGGARNKDFETENTSGFGRNPVIIEALESFLYNHLASKETKIDYSWSGIIGVGSQKLPIVKAVSPRTFVGLRCSGMGIALASLIGEKLADLVCNTERRITVNQSI
jgi:glycine/D-amino acid oxidase-like deaminating enzyme